MFAVMMSFPVSASNDERPDASSNQVYDRPYMQGTILFDSNMNGNWDIYMMSGDGHDLRQLTFSPADERWPTFGPDGRHIAYSSNEDGDFNIVIQDTSGERRFNLTHCCSNETQPDWGAWDQIAFVSDRSGNKDIYVKNVWNTPEDTGRGTSEAAQITFNDRDQTSPAWAGQSQGGVLAYVQNSDIWVMDTEKFESWPVREGGEQETSPAFHPYEGMSGGRSGQPEFMFLKGGKLYSSLIGWNNDYKQSNWPLNVPGNPISIAFSTDDPCTIAFITGDGGKIGLHDYCDNQSNPILIPDGNTNWGANRVDYGPNMFGGGGMMGGMGNMMGGMGNMMGGVGNMMGGGNPMGGGGNPMGGMGGGPSMGNMQDMMNMGDDMMQQQEQMMKQEEDRMRMESERREMEMNMERERDQERMDQMSREQEQRNVMDKERLASELDSQRERDQMERDRREQEMAMERERTEMQMEADRERMNMEQQRREEQLAMDREQMEQQREMMKNMEGSGGRESFYEPEERCFVEDEEESRGLFGNIDIGAEIDCGMDKGYQERLKDPATLAILGLVVTVGATLLQMVRGS